DVTLPSDSAGGYSVFGRVTEGLDILQQVGSAGTVEGSEQPALPLTIEGVTNELAADPAPSAGRAGSSGGRGRRGDGPRATPCCHAGGDRGHRGHGAADGAGPGRRAAGPADGAADRGGRRPGEQREQRDRVCGRAAVLRRRPAVG